MKLNSKFKKIIATAAFAGLAAFPAASNAAIINALFSGGINEIQDTDAERILDANGGVVTSGNFAVGQVLQSILRFDTVNLTTISDELPAPYKLTAYSELQIGAIQGSVSINGADVPNGVACGATDPFCSLILVATGNLGANVLATLYEGNSATGFNQGLAPAAGIAGVQSNTAILSVGLGKATDYWYATIVNPQSGAFVGNQIGLLTTVTATSGQRGQFNFGLSVLDNPGGIPVRNEEMAGIFGNMHDVIGNGSAYARSPGVDSGWLLSSNTLVQFNVPEPDSLALLGLVFVGMGAVGYRSKTKKS